MVMYFVFSQWLRLCRTDNVLATVSSILSPTTTRKLTASNGNNNSNKNSNERLWSSSLSMSSDCLTSLPSSTLSSFELYKKYVEQRKRRGLEKQRKKFQQYYNHNNRKVTFTAPKWSLTVCSSVAVIIPTVLCIHLPWLMIMKILLVATSVISCFNARTFHCVWFTDFHRF